LAHKNHHIELRVADDGRGFDSADVDSSSHLGMQGMAERVNGLGGTFQVHSQPGGGTVVTATIPHPSTVYSPG
jgi:signal transduction histidine kinase